MPVDQNEILSKAVATLRADAGLLALTGDLDPENPGEARVFNHVPQDEKQPYILVVWESGSENDTKDSTGFDGRLNHEAVSTHHGDREVLKMQDAVIAAYEANPIVLVAAEIICFQFASGSTPVNVFSTHRVAFFFTVIVDDDGVSGATLPPVAGGLIVVQEDGADLANTPHRKLNFDTGILAEDDGDGVVKITVLGSGLSIVSLGAFVSQFDLVAKKFRLKKLDSSLVVAEAVGEDGIDPASIVTESVPVITDPSGIVAGVVFSDSTIGIGVSLSIPARALTVTLTGTEIMGDTASIDWLWNGLPVSAFLEIL